jgi:hypothetical protein
MPLVEARMRHTRMQKAYTFITSRLACSNLKWIAEQTDPARLF